jgi:hypothetical protein
MKKVIIITVMLFIVLVSLFYWFQIRPTQIKHDCSWMKQHSDAIPTQPAESEDQLKKDGKIQTCLTESEYRAKYNLSSILGIGPMIDNPEFCNKDNERVIANYSKPKPAISAKDWYREATTAEYQFCLHDKGL